MKSIDFFLKMTMVKPRNHLEQLEGYIAWVATNCGAHMCRQMCAKRGINPAFVERVIRTAQPA